MISHPLSIDAFTGLGARGNRAAVMLCDELPPDAEMQARAAEIGAPATAFVEREEATAMHSIRWFDAKREIALCGHGALAAGHVLLTRSGKDAAQLRTADCREVTVRKAKGANRYELCLPAIATEQRDWPELAAALGAAPDEIRWNAAGYALAVFDTAAAVRALEPDLAAISALGNVQVSATAPGGADADIISRVFSSGREDAATGSAHAALAPYWCARFGREQLSAFQASISGGRFECRIDGDRVWLGGECRAVT